MLRKAPRLESSKMGNDEYVPMHIYPPYVVQANKEDCIRLPHPLSHCLSGALLSALGQDSKPAFGILSPSLKSVWDRS